MVPQYYLMRPVQVDNEDHMSFRLDQILLKAAQRGVKVHIVHWKESKFAVKFDSKWSKRYLTKLHENIRMLRHPRQAITMWSHHAKMCIIDQSICFIGGLDICYGRWDTQKHRLLDINNDPQMPQIFPGNDYSNEKLRVPVNCEDPTHNTLNREVEVRMPWHDIAVVVEGDTAMDIAHHYV